MKRLALFVGLFLCISTPIITKSPDVIKKTVRIIPNPVILLQEEVRETQWVDRGTDTTIQISQEDAQRLMKIAYAEAGNQGVEGQLRVMQAVYNRVLSDSYPDSIESVIEQDKQFSSVASGMYEDAEPTAETHQALALFESNKDHDSEIIGFETKENGRSLEKYFKFLYTLKDHNFYGIKQKKNP